MCDYGEHFAAHEAMNAGAEHTSWSELDDA